MSTRAVASVIQNYFGSKVSHQTIIQIAEYAAEIAEKHNKKLNLGHISCAIFDEIFKKKSPILCMADPVSGLIYLKAGEDRSGDEWEFYLNELKKLGLSPESVNTDGGLGLLKSLTKVFENSVQLRDMFHVQQKLYKALIKMEGICYSLIKKELDHNTENIDKIRVKCALAIDIYDSFAKTLNEFRLSSYMRHEERPGYYCSSKDLGILVDDCFSELDRFYKEISTHYLIRSARTYIKNGRKSIIAYKNLIEEKLKNAYGNTISDIFLRGIMPIVECMMQYQRTYENTKRKEYWGKKAVEMINELESYECTHHEEIREAIKIAWVIINSTMKSNSYIESVNSVIRQHLNTYGKIPQWFCQLFTFYWNNRVFTRGKRANKKPSQLDFNEVCDSYWVDKILEDFPFDKIRCGINADSSVAAA